MSEKTSIGINTAEADGAKHTVDVYVKSKLSFCFGFKFWTFSLVSVDGYSLYAFSQLKSHFHINFFMSNRIKEQFLLLALTEAFVHTGIREVNIPSIKYVALDNGHGFG